MATPTFTLGENTLSFTQGHQLPISDPLEKIQAIDRTASGSLQIESLGINISRKRLTFRGMSSSTYDELRTWFDTISNGAANSFIYTDENSNAFTVRWINGVLDFIDTRNGFYDGEILLEIVS